MARKEGERDVRKRFKANVSERLAATAALAAAAGAGSLGMWQSQTARADELHETKEAPSLCNGCSSKCGLVATTVDGQLWTLRGSDVHPYAKGHICGAATAWPRWHTPTSA